MKRLLLATTVSAAAIMPAFAQDMGHGDDPAPTIFNNIRTELDYAPKDGGLFTWDVDGWIGGDSERVWIRSEGEREDGSFTDAEVQLYYGWNVDTYWDVLIGVRQEFEPGNRTYLAASIVGLAPYFFETDASAFLSDRGDLSVRLEQSFDLLLTQRLIAEPHFEANLFAQDVPELNVGAGISDIEIGLQLRYEFTRRFAPYVDVVWERKLGETSGLARAAGESPDATSVHFGVRLMF